MRERLVVDVDQLDGVLGDGAARGSHADDRLALVGGLAHGQSEVGYRRSAGHGTKDADHLGPLDDILAGEDLEHTFELEGGCDVDRPDPRVRVRAAADSHLDGVSRVDVVGKAAGAPQQPVVLLAQLVGAEDAPAGHDHRRLRQGRDVTHRRPPRCRRGSARRRSG